MKTCIQALGILAVTASLSFAQGDKPAGPRQRPNPEAMFKKLDTDGNGFISLKEFKASPRAQKDEAKAEEIFNKINADGSEDGITLEEFKAHRPERGQRRGGKGPKGGEGKPPAAPAGE